MTDSGADSGSRWLRTRGRRPFVRALVALALAAALAAALAIAVAFARDLEAARERARAGSRLVETPCGVVEVAVRGSGPAALVLHGAGGGWDQGLLLGEMLLGDRYRVIAPSRFGYLRTPLPGDPGLPAQADALACLLDAEAVDDALVVGISAGGPPAVTFAARHPERTRALVLVAAVSDGGDHASALTTAVTETFLRSDFAYWALWRFARGTLLRALGLRGEVADALAPEEVERVEAVLAAMLPMSERAPGIRNDEAQAAAMRLERERARVRAPTLVIHARDDMLVPYAMGERSAREIQGARLHPLERGGHFLVGEAAAVRDVVARFVGSP